MAPVAATFAVSEERGSLVLAADGEWLVATAGELDRRLRALELPKDRQVTLDLAGIDRLDTAGAWLLLRTEHDLTTRGNAVELRNLQPDFAPLLDQVRSGGILAPATPSAAGAPHASRALSPGSARSRSGSSRAHTASPAFSASSV